MRVFSRAYTYTHVHFLYLSYPCASLLISTVNTNPVYTKIKHLNKIEYKFYAEKILYWLGSNRYAFNVTGETTNEQLLGKLCIWYALLVIRNNKPKNGKGNRIRLLANNTFSNLLKYTQTTHTENQNTNEKHTHDSRRYILSEVKLKQEKTEYNKTKEQDLLIHYT